MSAAGPAVKLTYDDFVLFPEDGMRHELIDGEHYVTPSPNMKHQSVSGTLFGLIWSHLETHPIGHVFHAPFDAVFTLFDVVEPDLLYISNARAGTILTADNVKETPELVAEIASTGTRKRDDTIKRRLYERAGVLEYWLVNPALAWAHAAADADLQSVTTATPLDSRGSRTARLCAGVGGP